MARTPKSKTQTPEPAVAGEATIATPNNPGVVDENQTNTPVPETQAPTPATAETPAGQTLEQAEGTDGKVVEKTDKDGEARAGGIVGDEVTPSADQQPSPKTKIPKVTTREQENPTPKTRESQPTPNSGVEEDALQSSMRRQLNPDEAMSWAATQPDQRAAIDSLKSQRRLLDITATYQLLEDRI